MNTVVKSEFSRGPSMMSGAVSRVEGISAKFSRHAPYLEVMSPWEVWSHFVVDPNHNAWVERFRLSGEVLLDIHRISQQVLRPLAVRANQRSSGFPQSQPSLSQRFFPFHSSSSSSRDFSSSGSQANSSQRSEGGLVGVRAIFSEGHLPSHVFFIVNPLDSHRLSNLNDIEPVSLTICTENFGNQGLLPSSLQLPAHSASSSSSSSSSSAQLPALASRTGDSLLLKRKKELAALVQQGKRLLASKGDPRAYSKAYECFQKVVGEPDDADPSDIAIAYVIMGSMHQDGKSLSQSYEKAETCYREAIKYVSPFQNRARVLLGSVRAKQGDLAEADSLFLYVIEHEKRDKPVLARALMELGCLRYKQEEYLETLKWWNRLAEMKDLDSFIQADANCCLANLYRLGHGVDQSIEKVKEYSERALQLSKISSGARVAAYDNLGWVCLAKKDYAKAFQNFQNALNVAFEDKRAENEDKASAHLHHFNYYYIPQGIERSVDKALEHGEKALLGNLTPREQTYLHFHMGMILRERVNSGPLAYNHFSAARNEFLTKDQQEEKSSFLIAYNQFPESPVVPPAQSASSSSSSSSSATRGSVVGQKRKEAEVN